MAASLTCLLCIFSYTRVNAYNKSTSTPIDVSGPWSGTEDDDKSNASCPPSAPILVSCGLLGNDHRMEGSYPDPSNGQCVAQNGDKGNGVRAVALCVNNDYTCTYHSGSHSGGEDDDTSTVGC
eukprot:3115_1